MRFAVVLVLTAACSEPAPTVWIAPAGSDAAACDEAAPCASLVHARDVLRMRGGGGVVKLRGGRYQLDATLELTGADDNVTFEAVVGDVPVVSGGRIVAQWIAGADGLRTHVDVTDFRELWIDGVLAPRARGPIPSELWIAGDVDNIAGVAGYVAATFPTFADPSALELGFIQAWSHKLCGVAAVVQETDQVRIDMEQPCFYLTTHDVGRPILQPAYLENADELVDEPHEWYFDRTRRELHVMAAAPPAETIVPVLEQLVTIRGAHDIRFDGVTFADATFLRPSTYGHPDIFANFILDARDPAHLFIFQNAVLNVESGSWKTPGAVIVDNSDAVTFHRCTFTRLGGSGLDVERGASDNKIIGNRFVAIGANAIQIGDVLRDDHHPTDRDRVVRDNVVMNNVVRDAGLVFEDSIGIFAGFTEHTVIAHNDLADLPYTAIAVGWGWGSLDPGAMNKYVPWNFDTPTTSARNEIVNNEIHDIMRRRTDGGGVYTLGAQPGTVIRGNHIHRAAGWFGGVYLDEGSAFIEVVANSVHDVMEPYYIGNLRPELRPTNNEHDNHFGSEVDVGAGLQPAYRDLLQP